MINIHQDGQKLTVSYYNTAGDIEFASIDIPDEEMFVWEYADASRKRTAPDPEWRSWDGKPIQKRKATRLDRFRIEEFLLNAPQEFRDRIYQFNVPKKVFVDIEVEVNDEFPDPENAKEPVTAIGFANEQNQIVVLGTKPLAAAAIDSITARLNKHFAKFGKEITFRYIRFPSEYSMLYAFFHKVIQQMPLVTGWNFLGYDWPYLINRVRGMERIEPERASPSGVLYGKQNLPQDRLVVDYLEVYKKWDRIIDVKDGNSLDAVALRALGVQKIKYNGTLQQLYEKDFETYIFYNAVDCFLVRLLDEKLNTMLTFLKLGDTARVEAQKAFGPIWVTEALMSREFYKRKQVFVVEYNKEKPERESYDGGYVWLKNPGMYEWVCCFDFASLYPSTMRQFNISPENFEGMAIEGVKHVPGKIVTASGAIFDDSQDSIMRVFLTDLYSQRKQSKGRSLVIEKEIDLLKQTLAARRGGR